MGRIRCTSTNRTGDNLNVTGILIDPSAGSWVLVVQDKSGATVFSAKGSTADAVYYDIKDNWVGANITTSTNITATYIYTN